MITVSNNFPGNFFQITESRISTTDFTIESAQCPTLRSNLNFCHRSLRPLPRFPVLQSTGEPCPSTPHSRFTIYTGHGKQFTTEFCYIFDIAFTLRDMNSPPRILRLKIAYQNQKITNTSSLYSWTRRPVDKTCCTSEGL